MPNESFVDREICERGSADRVQPLRGDVTPGADVQVRGRLWIVDAVAAHEDCTSLRLVDKRTGHPRVLLWPFDRPVAVTRSRRLRVVPLRRWWAEVASLCTDVRVGGLQVAPTAARIVPYQLAPVLAVAQGIARVFLADEVGLGKTIQAGWIVAERCARQSDARVLIAVPAGLRQQWQTELVTHFGIDAIVADAAWLRLAFSDLPADVNPWSLPGVYVTSIDFLKRPDVLRPIASLVWDALVVDEAHTAAAPTGRFAALSRISRRSRALVLITATPFSGDIAAFESLASLGTRTADDPPTMFRRSREDAGLSHTRRHRFASIRVSAAERHLHRLLERYTSEVWTSSPDEGARLAMTILRKRALSSPRTVARSLDRRIALLNARPSAPQQLSLFDDELEIGRASCRERV